MRNAVRLMLQFLEPGDFGLGIVPVSGHFEKKLTAFLYLIGQLFKMLKEIFFLWKQAHKKIPLFSFHGRLG